MASPLTRAPAPLLAALLAFAVHAPTLGHGFVYDDRFQVVENEWIRSLRHLPEIWSQGVWGFEGASSNYYRPVMHTVYALTYALAGLRPWAFHLANLLLHAAAAAALVGFVRALLERYGVPPERAASGALVGAALFAVHPALAEVVAWVAGVPELVCVLAALLALRAHLGRRPWLSGPAVLLALLSKETAVVLLGLLPALDVAGGERRPGVLARRSAPALLALGVYLFLRFSAVPGGAPVRRHPELDLADVVANAFPLFTDYLRTLVVPWPLNAFHVLHPVESLLSPRGLLSLLGAAGFACGLALAWRRSRPALVGLLLVGLPLLPVLYIPAVGENTFAERYLYLPACGLALLVAAGIGSVRHPRPWIAGLAGVLVLFAGLAVARDRVWASDATLWADTVRKSPDSAYAQNEWGAVLADEGRHAEARQAFRAAIALNPEAARAYANLGLLDAREGRLADAERGYRAALALRPDLHDARVNLGAALLQAGRIGEAVRELEEAVRRDPGTVGPRINLGNAYDARGERDRALEQYLAALAADPDSADAHLAVGTAYGERGDLPRALRHLEQAARLAPGDLVVRQNLEHARRLAGSR